MVTTHTAVQEDSIQLTEEELVIPLRDASIIRSSGLYPIKTIALPEDQQHIYWKSVDDFNLKYSMDPNDSPRSEQALTKTTTNVPVIHGQLGWGYDELKRIDRTKLGTDERIRNAVRNMALEEESICLTGAADDVTVTSVSTTGTNSTIATAEFSTASIATIHTTLTGMIGQLIDGNIDPSRFPLKFVVTQDVWKNALGRLDQNQTSNGIDFIQRILNQFGGAGSQLIMSGYLGGARATDAKKIGYTDGTTNACLFAVSSQFYEVVASPIDIRTDGTSKVSGLQYQYLERWRPIYKEKKGIIYSGTVVNA